MVTPPKHPLVGRRSVRLADLVRYPLLLGPPGNRARDRVDAALSQAQLLERADVVIEVGILAAVEEYVRRGLGVGVVIGCLPQMRRRYPDVALRSMSRCFGTAAFAFVRRRGAHVPPQARDFEQQLRTCIREA
jgi:DNA-binding transcriptional LysR family regulator